MRHGYLVFLWRYVGQQKTRIAVAGAGFVDLPILLNGAGERNRTLDLLITSELLYQLSYTGTTPSPWLAKGLHCIGNSGHA